MDGLEIDNIHVAGDAKDHSVTISFGNVDLVIRPDQAQALAFALMGEAGRAGVLDPCPTCGEYGCPELHGED